MRPTQGALLNLSKTDLWPVMDQTKQHTCQWKSSLVVAICMIQAGVYCDYTVLQSETKPGRFADHLHVFHYALHNSALLLICETTGNSAGQDFPRFTL